ncbi:MAG: hypothetical protein ACLQU9_13145 [Acidimicrobiales bacterium]
MSTDPIHDAILALEAKRDALTGEVNRLTQAISALLALGEVGAPQPPMASPRPVVVPPSGRLSVKQMMLQLLYEQDRDWNVNEILAEYQKRGTPIQAKDPSNALRAAVAEANKAGDIVRTTPGRYKAARPPSDSMDEIADSVPRSITYNRFGEGAPG